MPDPTPIIQQATNRGWEAGLLVFFFLVVVAFLGWLVRTWITTAAQREERMAARLDKVEDEQGDELRNLTVQCIEAFNKNTVAVDRITDALERRPCLLPGGNTIKPP